MPAKPACYADPEAETARSRSRERRPKPRTLSGWEDALRLRSLASIICLAQRDGGEVAGCESDVARAGDPGCSGCPGHSRSRAYLPSQARTQQQAGAGSISYGHLWVFPWIFHPYVGGAGSEVSVARASHGQPLE